MHVSHLKTGRITSLGRSFGFTGRKAYETPEYVVPTSIAITRPCWTRTVCSTFDSALPMSKVREWKCWAGGNSYEGIYEVRSSLSSFILIHVGKGRVNALMRNIGRMLSWERGLTAALIEVRVKREQLK